MHRAHRKIDAKMTTHLKRPFTSNRKQRAQRPEPWRQLDFGFCTFQTNTTATRICSKCSDFEACLPQSSQPCIVVSALVVNPCSGPPALATLSQACWLSKRLLSFDSYRISGLGECPDVQIAEMHGKRKYQCLERTTATLDKKHVVLSLIYGYRQPPSSHFERNVPHVKRLKAWKLLKRSLRLKVPRLGQHLSV